jgi:hypothetical protein
MRCFSTTVRRLDSIWQPCVFALAFFLIAALMFFVGIPAASADTLTPSSFVANTSATFNNVNVYYVDANPLANPWGLTSTCSAGCNPDPIGSDSSTPFTSETVVLRDTGPRMVQVSTSPEAFLQSICLAATQSLRLE